MALKIKSLDLISPKEDIICVFPSERLIPSRREYIKINGEQIYSMATYAFYESSSAITFKCPGEWPVPGVIEIGLNLNFESGEILSQSFQVSVGTIEAKS